MNYNKLLFRIPQFSWLLTLAATVHAENGIENFPSNQTEISIAISIPPNSKSSSADIDVLTSWATVSGWIHTVEAKHADSDWEAISESFKGDGKPVDFVDFISKNNLPVRYRIVSTKSDDSSHISYLSIRLTLDESSEKINPSLFFSVTSGYEYLVQISKNLEEWHTALKFIEQEPLEIEINDTILEYSKERYYRILVNRIQDTGNISTELNPYSNTQHYPEKNKSISARIESPSINAPSNVNLGNRLTGKIHRVIRSLRFTTSRVVIPAGQHYVTIPMGLENTYKAVAVLDSGHTLLSRDQPDGTKEMVIWRLGRPVIYISKLTGVYFNRILALDDSSAAVGTVMEDGKEKLLGFRYKTENADEPIVTALTEDELMNFKLHKYILDFEGVVYMSGKKYYPHSEKDPATGEMKTTLIQLAYTIDELLEMVGTNDATHDQAWVEHQIGAMYLLGIGVNKSEKDAANWLTKAANRGHINSQYLCGKMCRLGTGQPIDHKHAVHYYNLAVGQGDTRAMYDLAMMYDLGLGVEKNRTFAYALLSVAASRDSTHSKQRDLKGKTMSPSQIKEAKKLISKLMREIELNK